MGRGLGARVCRLIVHRPDLADRTYVWSDATAEVSDALLFIAPAFRVVLHDFGRQHEDVFVHQRDAERIGINRPAHSLDLRHISSTASAMNALNMDGFLAA